MLLLFVFIRYILGGRICVSVWRKCADFISICIFMINLNMECQKEHFRHILLFYFHSGKRAADAFHDICKTYGVNALSQSTCDNWFAKFRSGNFSLQDVQRSGRPVGVDDDQLMALIEANRHVTVRELAEKTNASIGTVHEHVKKLGLVKKLDVWVPHELKEIHLTQRVSICDLHLKRNEDDPFLKRIVTGDEKWIVYNNATRKRSWSKPDEPAQTMSKAHLHQKRVMLSVWWDYKGVIYFEVLPRNQNVNSDLYCQQLMKLDEAI